MEFLITFERFKIYQNYRGDIDAMVRRNSKREFDKFGENLDESWEAIDNSVQDIELIEKGLVSAEYRAKALLKLKSVADNKVFDLLTARIKSVAYSTGSGI